MSETEKGDKEGEKVRGSGEDLEVKEEDSEKSRREGLASQDSHSIGSLAGMDNLSAKIGAELTNWRGKTGGMVEEEKKDRNRAENVEMTAHNFCSDQNSCSGTIKTVHSESVD